MTRNLLVNYEIIDGEKVNGEYAHKEAFTIITVSDYIATNLLESGKSGCANNKIEKLLSAIESLKDRCYVRNSIKSFKEA